MKLKDLVYKVEDLRDLDDSTFQWLHQLSPSPSVRNGYYLLYKSKFNGDWVRLGRWYGCDGDGVYKDYCKELCRSASGDLRIVQIDIKD
jgi:hypothetical protein